MIPTVQMQANPGAANASCGPHAGVTGPERRHGGLHLGGAWAPGVRCMREPQREVMTGYAGIK